jgi:hypothetical protein
VTSATLQVKSQKFRKSICVQSGGVVASPQQQIRPSIIHSKRPYDCLGTTATTTSNPQFNEPLAKDPEKIGQRKKEEDV